MDKHGLSWVTRLKLCWEVLIFGKYDPRDFKTIHEQEQWEVCEKRRKEMASTVRPRTERHYPSDNDWLGQ